MCFPSSFYPYTIAPQPGSNLHFNHLPPQQASFSFSIAQYLKSFAKDRPRSTTQMGLALRHLVLVCVYGTARPSCSTLHVCLLALCPPCYFETLVILLSEFDKLVEVEYDEVGDKTDSDHRVGEVVEAEGISSTPDGLLKSVEKVSWG
jgi:hypothetical protein